MEYSHGKESSGTGAFLQRCDCHNHSNCSPDGDQSPWEMCQRAKALGLFAYTLTDHCECNKYEERYREKVLRAREEMIRVEARLAAEGPQEGFRFYKGIELGQPVQNVAAAAHAVDWDYDFVIGSVHNIRGYEDFFFLDYTNVEQDYIHSILSAYFQELLETVAWGNFDALGHLTYPLRYIEGEHGIPVDMGFHREEVDAVLSALAKKDKALEVNTSGLRQKIGRTLPELSYVKRFRELGGKLITLGSDAHCTEDLGKGITEGMALLLEAGFREFALFEKRKPRLVPLSNI